MYAYIFIFNYVNIHQNNYVCMYFNFHLLIKKNICFQFGRINFVLTKSFHIYNMMKTACFEEHKYASVS